MSFRIGYDSRNPSPENPFLKGTYTTGNSRIQIPDAALVSLGYRNAVLSLRALANTRTGDLYLCHTDHTLDIAADAPSDTPPETNTAKVLKALLFKDIDVKNGTLQMPVDENNKPYPQIVTKIDGTNVQAAFEALSSLDPRGIASLKKIYDERMSGKKESLRAFS